MICVPIGVVVPTQIIIFVRRERWRFKIVCCTRSSPAYRVNLWFQNSKKKNTHDHCDRFFFFVVVVICVAAIFSQPLWFSCGFGNENNTFSWEVSIRRGPVRSTRFTEDQRSPSAIANARPIRSAGLHARVLSPPSTEAPSSRWLYRLRDCVVVVSYCNVLGGEFFFFFRTQAKRSFWR